MNDFVEIPSWNRERHIESVCQLPKCNYCNVDMNHIGSLHVSIDGRIFQSFSCPDCDAVFDIPIGGSNYSLSADYSVLEMSDNLQRMEDKLQIQEHSMITLHEEIQKLKDKVDSDIDVLKIQINNFDLRV